MRIHPVVVFVCGLVQRSATSLLQVSAPPQKKKPRRETNVFGPPQNERSKGPGSKSTYQSPSRSLQGRGK